MSCGAGIVCLGNFSDRGNKKTEEKLVELEQDIRALAEPQSQQDPKFQSPFLYTRMTAKAMRKALIEQKGWTDEELPHENTIGVILNRATSTTLRGPALLIALGMPFGAIGDLVLADVIPLPKRMISGIIVFSIAHLCYIAGFSQIAGILGLNDPITESLVWVIFVIVAAFLWFFLIHNPAKSRVLNIGSLFYGWLIAIMAGTATALALSDPRFTLTAIGGVLFLISDIILGNRELRDNGWFLVHDVVWVLYIAGQAADSADRCAGLTTLRLVPHERTECSRQPFAQNFNISAACVRCLMP